MNDLYLVAVGLLDGDDPHEVRRAVLSPFLARDLADRYLVTLVTQRTDVDARDTSVFGPPMSPDWAIVGRKAEDQRPYPASGQCGYGRSGLALATRQAHSEAPLPVPGRLRRLTS